MRKTYLRKEKENMKKRITSLIALLIMTTIMGLMCSCGGVDDPGAAIDWGPNYYYDTNKHSVQKKPW